MKCLFTLLMIGIPFVVYTNYEDVGMKVESSAFVHGQVIPKKYTCMGQDLSPPLKISQAPKETHSFVIIVDDPDAPMGTFDHWLAWNIPSSMTTLAEGAHVPSQGTNGFRDTKYRGPCPPPGKPHRYFFKVYALDTELSLPNGSGKRELESAMEGHIIAKTELVGLFQR